MAQMAIAHKLLSTMESYLLIIVASPSSLKLCRQLNNYYKLSYLTLFRIPGFARPVISTVLSFVCDLARIELVNIVASVISKSLFFKNSQVILSGDGIGFSNLPEWNSNLMGKRLNNFHAGNTKDLSPYSINPPFKKWLKNNCIDRPSITINNYELHDKIIKLIESTSLVVNKKLIEKHYEFKYIDVCLIALSAFSENNRITEDDEVALVNHLLISKASQDCIILLKPHPFNCNSKIVKLKKLLREKFADVILLDNAQPVEFLLSYAYKNWPNFTFFSFQQSAVSALLIDNFIGQNVLEFGFGTDLLHFYWSKTDLKSRLFYENWISSALQTFNP